MRSKSAKTGKADHASRASGGKLDLGVRAGLERALADLGKGNPNYARDRRWLAMALRIYNRDAEWDSIPAAERKKMAQWAWMDLPALLDPRIRESQPARRDRLDFKGFVDRLDEIVRKHGRA